MAEAKDLNSLQSGFEPKLIDWKEIIPGGVQMVFLVYVVKFLTVNEENRVRAPKTPNWNSSKVGQCVGLKIRRYRFESCLFHLFRNIV